MTQVMLAESLRDMDLAESALLQLTGLGQIARQVAQSGLDKRGWRMIGLLHCPISYELFEVPGK
jgi:hypothetical protein